MQRSHIFLQMQGRDDCSVYWFTVRMWIREAGYDHVPVFQVLHEGRTGRQNEHGQSMWIMYRGIGREVQQISDILLQASAHFLYQAACL